MDTLPKLNSRYWLTLVMASIFGTNTGDYLSDGLGLGHLAGLPWVAGALVLVFAAERLSPLRTAVFFWAAIIVIRTGATNIGDAFHDYGIGFGLSVPLVLACFAAGVWVYRSQWLRSGSGAVGVNPAYWMTMILAGVLGTIGGDAASFRLGLTPAGTAIVFLAFVALAVIVWGRRGRLAEPLPYWVTLALIRTAGTGTGDALAHRLGLDASTLLTGALFIGMVVYFYAVERNNTSPTAVDRALASAA